MYLSISIALLTAWAFQKQLTLCRSLHVEALEATVSEGLAQGPYMMAGANNSFHECNQSRHTGAF